MNIKKPNFIIISGSGDTFVWFRLELLAAIQSKGFTVYALAPEISDKNKLILEERGINFLKIKLKRKSFNFLNFIQSCIELNKIFNELKPEIVLGYMHKSILASCIVSLFHKNIKVFSMITGLGHLFERQSLKYTILKKVFSIFFKISFKRASKIFFQNPDDKNLFLNLNLVENSKSVCIPGSGVNTEEFNEIVLPENPIFMTMGRFLESKGLREFAAAAQQMKSIYPESRFILYGYPDAHEDSISEQEIKQTWHQEYGVELMGFADDPKFAISQCSIFVLLSYREGVPRTVLEAMSLGRPIITTDAPGCRETVENGLNGFLVPVRDVDNTVIAMKQLIDANLRSKMGVYSRQIAIKKFDVSIVNKIIIHNIF
jgi:glycosyltransferase involved in cell wall biosynthesis